MTDILDEARDALDRTTEGPWYSDTGDGDYERLYEVYAEDDDDNRELVGAALLQNARFFAWARDGVPELVAEVERLRAQVAQAWEACRENGELADQLHHQNETLRAQIAAVQALHHVDSYGDCSECPGPYDFGPNTPWPCPTIRALDGEATDD